MIRDVVQVILLIAVLSVVFMKVDGKSIVDNISERGIKPTAERIWNGK